MRRPLIILIAAIIALAAQARTFDFAWGADVAGSIDMTGNDMSDIGMNAYAGVKNRYVEILGIGVGYNAAVSNSQRELPIYVIVQPVFLRTSQTYFVETRVGTSINYLENNRRQAGAYGSAGIGINLASSAKFASSLVLGYTYIGRESYKAGETTVLVPDLHLITMRLGVTF